MIVFEHRHAWVVCPARTDVGRLRPVHPSVRTPSQAATPCGKSACRSTSCPTSQGSRSGAPEPAARRGGGRPGGEVGEQHRCDWFKHPPPASPGQLRPAYSSPFPCCCSSNPSSPRALPSRRCSGCAIELRHGWRLAPPRGTLVFCSLLPAFCSPSPPSLTSLHPVIAAHLPHLTAVNPAAFSCTGPLTQLHTPDLTARPAYGMTATKITVQSKWLSSSARGTWEFQQRGRGAV